MEVLSFYTVLWDEKICPFFGSIRCIAVSVNGGFNVIAN